MKWKLSVYHRCDSEKIRDDHKHLPHVGLLSTEKKIGLGFLLICNALDNLNGES